MTEIEKIKKILWREIGNREQQIKGNEYRDGVVGGLYVAVGLIEKFEKAKNYVYQGDAGDECEH
jgi:hypothetical protein